jgi:hypothetical protein
VPQASGSSRVRNSSPRLEGKGYGSTLVLAIGVCLSARVTRVGGSMTIPRWGDTPDNRQRRVGLSA